MTNRFIKTLIIFTILSSCSVGLDYKKPKIDAPQSWFSFSSQKTTSNRQSRWWENFGDETLNQLIATAIQENLDLKIAYQRIEEARANVDEKTSYLYPKINAGASASRKNNFTNFSNPTKRTIANNFSTGFDASWEIDLFGSARRGEATYKALFEAENEAKNTALISLIAEVAKNYMNFCTLKNQINLTTKIISDNEEIARLEKIKSNAGLISEVDLHKTKIELINKKITLPDLETKLLRSQFAIEILLGRQPGELQDLLYNPDNKFVPTWQEKLAIKTPIEIIRNRPDIKKAERDLQAATELEGVAIAGLYPKISLTGFLGFHNNKSGQLLKSQSKAFSIAGGISLPILNFGEVKSNIKIYNSQKEQALLTYQKVVLLALQDVENALTSYSNQQKILVEMVKALENSQLIVKLSEEKYQQGLISLPQLLQEKINFYQIHQQLIQSQTNFNNSVIALYKSFGEY